MIKQPNTDTTHPILADTIAILGDLVAFPTVSSASNLALIDYIKGRLMAGGAEVMLDPSPCKTKANLFATLSAVKNDEANGERRGVVLTGHTDVVPVVEEDWAYPPFAVTQKNGRLYGRGTCDMKGFLAVVLALLGRLKEAAAQATSPLYLAFTYDEEVGCVGAARLAESLAAKGIRPRLAIVGEPTGMKLIDGHKGCCHYSTHFSGLAGHGSDPEAGVNAAEYASRYAMRLLEWREKLRATPPKDSPYTPPHTSINIGRIVAGVAHNVIADKARLDWEIRPVVAADLGRVKKDMADWCAETLLPEMQARHPQASIRLETLAEAPGCQVATANGARDIMLEVTGENGSDVAAYCTEAGVFQGAGMECIVCGPGSINQAHQVDEYIEISQLTACIKAMGRLADKIAQGRVG